MEEKGVLDAIGSCCMKQVEFEDATLCQRRRLEGVCRTINFNHKNTKILSFSLHPNRIMKYHILISPNPLRSTSSIGCNPLSKRLGIPGLHINRSGSGELTHQAFAGAHARDHSAGGDALHDIFTAPGYEMAVVDDIFLAINELDFERG
jgi:hypothetical protein